MDEAEPDVLAYHRAARVADGEILGVKEDAAEMDSTPVRCRIIRNADMARLVQLAGHGSCRCSRNTA